MAANQQSNESARYFKLIAKAEKADQAGNKAICENVKKGDKYEQGEWFSSLTGRIVDMSVRNFEYEGKPKQSYRIKLNDGVENCVLEFSLNIATYGLINSLLNTNLNLQLEVGAYISKKGYVGAYVKELGSVDTIGWSIPLESQPKPVEYDTPDGKQKSYKNVNEFWHQKFVELGVKVKSGAGVEPEFDTKPSQASVEDDSTDLPF